MRNIFNKNKVRKSKGFTLLELIITIIVIGILASIAIPKYAKTKEKQFDNEAIGILNLVRIAERNYRIIHGQGWWPSGTYTTSNLEHINGNLSLALIESPNWTLFISTDISCSITPCCYIRLKRKLSPGSQYFRWQIHSVSENNTYCSGACL